MLFGVQFKQHCLYLLAGMAKLHPEECRSRLYRAGQRRQVGDATYPFISSLFAISQFPVSPVLHHRADPLLKSFWLLWPGGSLWFWAGKKKINDGWGEVEVELGRVRVDYLWVQVSVQYLPVPVGFGKRREVRKKVRGLLITGFSVTHGKWFLISSCPSVSVCLSGLTTCSYLCCL